MKKISFSHKQCAPMHMHTTLFFIYTTWLLFTVADLSNARECNSENFTAFDFFWKSVLLYIVYRILFYFFNSISYDISFMYATTGQTRAFSFAFSFSFFLLL